MKTIVFLTGAGMSVESGFKTFRGADGLWEDFPVSQVATHEAWLADPELVTNFYNTLRRKLYAAQPCEGHRLIARMENEYEVLVVTQNVDNLHERGGSTHVCWVQQADVFVIIGTSLNVYPAAGLSRHVRPGTPIYLIDPNDVAFNSSQNIMHIREGASQGVKKLIEILSEK